MVEKQLEDYQRQLDRLKYMAGMFGVFDQCKSMFDNFYKSNKEDIIYLLNNDKLIEDIVEIDVYDAYDTPEAAQVFAFNKLWDEKMAHVMKEIGNISLEKTRWLPSQYANIFKEQHQIVSDLVENISVYNQLRYDKHTKHMELDYRISISSDSDTIDY